MECKAKNVHKRIQLRVEKSLEEAAMHHLDDFLCKTRMSTLQHLSNLICRLMQCHIGVFADVEE